MNSFNSALNWGTKYTQRVPIELDNSFDFPYDYITFAYYTTHCVDEDKFPIQSWINFYELLSVIHFSTKRRLRTFLTLHISLLFARSIGLVCFGTNRKPLQFHLKIHPKS